MVMLPPVAGALTVKVKLAVPPFGAIGAAIVQLSKAPALLSGVQLAPLAEVASIPAGN